MPRVLRRRRITAPAASLWMVISDPYHLPRWWPNTQRVENVAGRGQGSSWTQVLGTRDGRGIRADYRCVAAVEGKRYAFEQTVEQTPFEKFLKSSRVEIDLEAEDGETDVTMALERRMRGLSRLGSPLMRRAIARQIDETLTSLESVLGEEEGAGA